MKKYFVHYYNKEKEYYHLYWADSREMEYKLPYGANRIKRDEAIRLCIKESLGRKKSIFFTFNSDVAIYPAGYDRKNNIENDENYKLVYYIWERR